MFDKQQYVNNIKKYNKVCIYGAGKIARNIYKICKESNINILAFYVTKKENNVDEIEGIPVIQFDEYVDKDILILLGVLEHGKRNIKNYILEYGSYNVLDVPDDILYIDDFYAEKRRNPTIEITPIVGCSVNCRYCPQGVFLSAYYKKNKNRKSKMSLDEFKICLDKLPTNTLIEWAGFVEPFLNSESIDMMEYANQKGFKMTLFTTLVGLSMDKLERVLKIPFKQVVLHTADVDGFANIPITSDYLNMLEIIVNYKKKDGTFFIDSANCQSQPHKKVLDVVDGKLKIYCELSDRAGNLKNNEDNLKETHVKGRICCERADELNHNVLLPDGTMVLCCNDFGIKHELGNLIKNEYLDIIHGNEMRKIKCGMNIDENVDILCRRCMYAKNVNR